MTTGTAAGTQALTGTWGGPFAFNPNGFTVFNGQVLFDGTDFGGVSGLWTTNGTAAGTHELTTVAKNPTDLTVFDGQVLFSGIVSGTAVWIVDDERDGGGTHELAVSGAPTTGIGLDPSDLTVFGSEVAVQRHRQLAVKVGLWETNGTTATNEIPHNRRERFGGQSQGPDSLWR